MKRLIFTLFIVICIVIGVYIGSKVSSTSTRTPLLELKNKSSVSPTPDVPQTISIPKIDITTSIESVSVDNQGRMDVPKNWNNTAWYNKGPRPGESGSAVINGHVDNPQGQPAAFWNIKKLQPGDNIVISDKKGKSYIYKVSTVTDYPLTSIPLKNIFDPQGESKLNLITCSGTWDRTKHEYTNRTVVYSNLVTNKK